MSINDRFAVLLPQLLDRHGFDAVLQQSTPAAGGDFDTGDPTWSDLINPLRAVWDRQSNSGSERLGDERARSQSRVALLIAYIDQLKDNSTVGNKRITFNGTAYNIAAVAMIGDRVGLSLTLEDGVAT